MSPGPARIVIAERWSVLRRGLIGLLDGVHTVVDHFGEVTGVREAVSQQREVDLVVVGDEVGVDLVVVVAELCAPAGAPPVIVLSDDVGHSGLRGLLRAGARGVFSKRVDDDELLDGIGRVLAGDRVIDQRFLPLLFGGDDLEAVSPDADPAESVLTPRELDVLVQLARGSSNREIADALVVGESTVKTHLGRIYAKLDVEGRHHAVGRALELGLLG